MSSTVSLDALRQRHVEAKQADVARNALIKDLLEKVDDMQKTMDRNAFVMVLIDGNCMNFLNELVKQGIAGGDKAAQLLRAAVFEYLRYEESFKHDHKIAIRIYANLRGLSKTYADMGILPNAAAFSKFVLGFNKAHPLCDFIDYEEAADTKLKEVLSLYVYNVHCKQIIFGASADNGYASFLSSFFIDTDVSSRIRILKGPPFSYEFKSIISKFGWTEFKNVFRSEFISKEPVKHHPWRRSKEAELRTREALLSSINNNSSSPWRPKTNSDLYSTNLTISENTAPILEDLIKLSDLKTSEVDQESDGDRFDVSVELNYNYSPALSTASSSQGTPPQVNGNPAAAVVEAALINITNECLKESPKTLDFGFLKQRVEQILGLTPDFWGKGDHDEWVMKIKKIIKIAVEDWVERTDNPPPKNATWMLRYFTSLEESPSSVMRNPSSKLWRTKREITKQPSGFAISGRIYQSSEGRRIDLPKKLNVSRFLINALRDREPRLCNMYYLVRDCTKGFCGYDHASILSVREFEALLYLSRSQICPQGSDCTSAACIKGHMCPNGNDCRHGSSCRFAHLHDIDTNIAIEVMAS